MSVNTSASFIVKFNGLNYREWLFRVSIALEAEGIDVDAEKPASTDAAGLKLWKKSDALARKIIIDRMNAEEIELVMNSTSAKEMLEELKRIYARKNTLNCIQTKRKLLKLNFDEKESATSHLTNFEKLINELRAYGEEITADEIIGYFQVTLPDSYDCINLYFDALPAADKNINNLKARFIEEYNKRKNKSNGAEKESKAVEEGSTAFYSNKRGKNDRNFRKFNDTRGNSKNYSNYNNHSNSDSHSSSSHNYRNIDRNRDNMNDRNVFRQNFSNDREFKCYSCGKTGHIARNCNNNRQRKAFFSLSVDDVKSDDIKYDEIKFFLDSGATDHMICEKYGCIMKNIENFENALSVKSSKQEISLSCSKSGEIEIITNKNFECAIKEVLCVKDLHSNLLSVSKLDEKGYTIVFKHDKAFIYDRNDLLAVGEGESGLYSFIFKLSNSRELQANACFTDNRDEVAKVWHRRFGHLNYKSLNDLQKYDMVDGIDKNVNFNNVTNIDKCDVCVSSKQKENSHTKLNIERTKRPFQLVHIDLMIVNQLGRNDEKYVLTCIDDYTAFKAAYCMKSKSETLTYFKDFYNYVRANSNFNVFGIRCDNGSEFNNRSFVNFCRDNGIYIQFVDPYTPVLNSCAERNNRTIIEKARSILLESKLEMKFWPDAIETAAYILNRIVRLRTSQLLQLNIYLVKRLMYVK